MSDDMAPILKKLGAPWYVRLALKWGRGGIVSWFTKLFEGKPGLLRTVTVVYILAVVVLKALGLESVAGSVGTVFSWLGLLSPDSPVPPEQAVAVLLAAVAAGRALVRWILDAFKAPVA